MIEFKIVENLEDSCHNDLKIAFNFANVEEIGDSYHFSGIETDLSFDDVLSRVIIYYKKSFDKLKELFVGRSLFWFYHIFDESDNGLLITNTDNIHFSIQFCTKCKYSSGEEFVFYKEIYFVDKITFLMKFENELNKYSPRSP